MPDQIEKLQPVSAITPVIVPGKYGDYENDGCGVSLCLVPQHSCLLVIAKRGKASELATYLKKNFQLELPSPGKANQTKERDIRWAGYERWFLSSEKKNDAAFYKEALQKLADVASITDQTHARVILKISGPYARAVLEKGMPVDLHSRVFGVGCCAVTEIAKVGIHLTQTGKNQYEVSAYRSFAENLWHWINEMSLEFGCQIDV